MRYPEGHKDEVRRRIVAAASEALRAHGLAGVSIPALMRRAGLTHGGFYAHFHGRDELVAEAVEAAAGGTGESVFAKPVDLAGVLDVYLSKGHVEHPEQGCVLAALGTDASRQAPVVQSAFARTARGMLRFLEAKRPGSTSRGPSDETLVRASLMIGAVVLARLVQDDALSGRILKAARRAADG